MKAKNRVRCLALGAGLVVSAAVAAADFDGSARLTCAPLAAYSCEPGKACSTVKPESVPPRVMTVDPPNKTAKVPYRAEPLSIENIALNDEQLQLQGTADKFAWSAVVYRQTGKISITIADRIGAYVLFGQCKLAADR